ncbi:hypothetical protein [Streptomyces sp. NPDC002671]
MSGATVMDLQGGMVRAKGSDYALGRYRSRFTTVRAVCGPGSSATAPKLLDVTARADYEDVSAADRQHLARIARSADEKLTHRIGCETRLPDRALAVPVRDANPVASCLLAVSPDQVGRIAGGCPTTGATSWAAR